MVTMARWEVPVLVNDRPARRRPLPPDTLLRIECAAVWAASSAISIFTIAALIAIAIPGGWAWWHVGVVASAIGVAAIVFVALLAAMDGLHL